MRVCMVLHPSVLSLQLVSRTSSRCCPRPGSCPGSSTDPRWSSTTTWSPCPTSRTLPSTPPPLRSRQRSSRPNLRPLTSAPWLRRVRPRAKEVRLEPDRENPLPVAFSVTLCLLCYTLLALLHFSFSVTLFFLCYTWPSLLHFSFSVALGFLCYTWLPLLHLSISVFYVFMYRSKLAETAINANAKRGQDKESQTRARWVSSTIPLRSCTADVPYLIILFFRFQYKITKQSMHNTSTRRSVTNAK